MRPDPRIVLKEVVWTGRLEHPLLPPFLEKKNGYWSGQVPDHYVRVFPSGECIVKSFDGTFPGLSFQDLTVTNMRTEYESGVLDAKFDLPTHDKKSEKLRTELEKWRAAIPLIEESLKTRKRYVEARQSKLERVKSLIAKCEKELKEREEHVARTNAQWGMQRVRLNHGICIVYKRGLWVFLGHTSQRDVRLDLEQLLRARRWPSGHSS